MQVVSGKAISKEENDRSPSVVLAGGIPIHRSLHQVLSEQTDENLLCGFTQLIEGDRKRKADFLIYLNEVDQRKLYAKQGYSSLFRFLTEKYFFSESSALKRIQAARLVKKFPFLYRSIGDGLFSLSALSRLAPFVNRSNSHLLFSACEGQSVRVVENVLVRFFPKEEVRDRLKKTISPLGVDRVQVQFTADKGFLEDLEKAKALLSHRYPQGKLADVLGLALRRLVEGLEKDKAGGLLRPSGSQRRASSLRGGAEAVSRKPAVPPNEPKVIRNLSRYIPRGIRREVWGRDKAYCQFLKSDGTLCGETRFLEIDHIHPFSLGGSNKGENLRLLCWAHNALRAEQTFGKRGKPS